MKMAVASETEIDKAIIIAGILEDISRGQYPRDENGNWEEDGPDSFDVNDGEHVDFLLETLERCGGLFRVAFGYAIITDPKNRIIDPDLDYLELHPRLRDGLEAVEHPFRFWFMRLYRGIADILIEGWNL